MRSTALSITRFFASLLILEWKFADGMDIFEPNPEDAESNRFVGASK